MAEPMSEALVRKPKLAPCAWRGMTDPAAVKAVVIAVPTAGAEDRRSSQASSHIGVLEREERPAPRRPTSDEPRDHDARRHPLEQRRRGS